ncbi:hypothetical protein MY3296_007288 [Beauveria thailandica]
MPDNPSFIILYIRLTFSLKIINKVLLRGSLKNSSKYL